MDAIEGKPRGAARVTVTDLHRAWRRYTTRVLGGNVIIVTANGNDQFALVPLALLSRLAELERREAERGATWEQGAC